MANYRFDILLAISLTLVSGLPQSQLFRNIALAENQPSQSLNSESPRTILKMGDKGESVKKLQTELQKLGFFDGEIDGFYGKRTYNAVIEFQTNKGLLVDGIVADKTWNALAEDIDKQEISQPPVDDLETKLQKNAHIQQIQKNGNSANNLPLIVIFAVTLLGMTGGFWLLFQVLKINNTQNQNLEAANLNQSELPNQEIPVTEAINSHNSATNQLPELPLTAPMEDLNVSQELTNSPVTNSESKLETTETTVIESTYPEKQSQNSKTKSVSHLKVISSGQFSNNSSSAITETTNNANPSSLAKVDLVQELIKDLNQPEPSKRRRAVWELAQRADSRAIEPLVNLMSKADSQETSIILEALTQIATRTLKPLNRAMNMALENDNAEVRKNAIRDLTRIYEVISGVSQQLSLATEDIDPEVQKTAQWALGQLHKIKTSANIASLPGEEKEKLPHDNNGNAKVRFL